MDKLREEIVKLIEKYEGYVNETEEVMGDDFNPMDASGGNFDDAYDLGYRHGEEYGKLEAYREILELLDEREDD